MGGAYENEGRLNRENPPSECCGFNSRQELRYFFWEYDLDEHLILVCKEILNDNTIYVMSVYL